MLSSEAMVDFGTLAREGIRPLRRAEYDKRVELGLFEEERIELLAGVLVQKSPSGPAYAHAVGRLNELFVVALHGRAVVRPQLPMALSDDSEPEPDLVVSPAGEYWREHPSQAYLVIEVADSSLRKDRRIKGALYAAAGIPEYWLVNLVDKVFEVHRDPQPAGYDSIVRVGRGETIAPLRFPDLVVAIDDVIPS
jgi:Uma2 family endonuclease